MHFFVLVLEPFVLKSKIVVLTLQNRDLSYIVIQTNVISQNVTCQNVTCQNVNRQKVSRQNVIDAPRSRVIR